MIEQEIARVSPEVLRNEALAVLRRRSSTIDVEAYESIQYSGGYTDLYGGIQNVLECHTFDTSIAGDLRLLAGRTWSQLQRLEVEAGITKLGI